MSRFWVRQSDLASYARCPQQFKLRRQARENGSPEQVLSATAYGSVIHEAIHVLERRRLEGDENALRKAVQTFDYYWHPDNISSLPLGAGQSPLQPVDIWLPRQTWAGLKDRAHVNLAAYEQHLEADSAQGLALEVFFKIPVALEPFSSGEFGITGTMDRLSLKVDSKGPYLLVSDHKSGAKPVYLRYNQQFTLYCWATTFPEFWEPWPPEDLDPIVEALHARGMSLWEEDGYTMIRRKAEWQSFQQAFAIHNAGWREEADYQRLRLAIAQFADAVDKEVFPLNLKGDTCFYCPYARSGECGGIPIAEEE